MPAPAARRAASILAVALWVLGCADGGPIGPGSEGRTLTVDPAALTLTPGASYTLTARMRDGAGNVVAGGAVAWSTDAAGVASVSAGGAVSARAAGVARITARAGSASAAATITVSATGSPSAGRILVDASRDGGVWWFPQWQSFDPSASHQGQGLADYLRSLGYAVDELPRPFAITSELLGGYGLVIRANGFGAYAPAELDAYRRFVADGGGLLLLSDHMRYAPADDLALTFGIELAGITAGENLLADFAAHPVTEGLQPLWYGVGSAIIVLPEAAQALGWLSAASYVDLNGNGVRDSTEASAPVVLAAMRHGAGRVVVCGDTNLWEGVPQPLVSNVLRWLEGT